MRFDEFVDRALYGEGGFYASGRGAGRRGDFLTSPEVGSLFGAVIASALDAWWDELGQPDPYVVVEAGAGQGTLAASVSSAAPRCAEALDYIQVDRASGTELPAAPFTGVIIANELLDNIPFRLFERGEHGWSEVYVDDGRERLVPAELDLDVDAQVGERVPLQEQATAWVADALALLECGRLVIIDYADTTQSMANRRWTDWVRTYRGHARGGHPLESPGEQDVTCEVAVDQLPPPTTVRTQGEFLRAHGIDELTEAARTAWQERAHIGDLEALKHRSRVHEAAALTDPTGLGGFSVLEWVK